jgi:hypothetical protein
MWIEVVAREKSGRMTRLLRTGMQHVVREFLYGYIYHRDAMLAKRIRKVVRSIPARLRD